MHKVVIGKAELLFLFFAVFAIVAVRLTMIAANFDPNYDQSMLLANFPLDRVSDLFDPLPYFEQTTTLGHGSLMDALARIFGPEGMARVNSVRLIAALAFCGSLLWLHFLLRGSLDPVEALLATVLIGSSPIALTFSVDSKHYPFEFVATVALLGAALHYLRMPGVRRGIVVILAGLFASLFAFVAPITIAAVGSATLVAQLIDAWQRKLPAQQVWRNAAGTLAVGTALVLIAAGFYLGYTRIVTVNDLTAFAGRDSKKFIEIDDLLSGQSLGNVLEYATYFFKFLEIGVLEYETSDRLERMLMAAPALVFYAVGIVVLWKRSPFWVTTAVVAPAITLAFNLARVMPFSGVRQHMFAAPLIAPVMVVGLVCIVRWVTRRLAGQQAANAGLALIAVAGILCSVGGALHQKGDVTQLMDEIDASGAPVWAYYGAQPLLRSLRPGWTKDESVLVGAQISHRSGNRPWVRRARFDDDSGMRPEYYSSAAQAISGHDRIWLVFEMWHFDVSRVEGLEVFIRHARGPGRDCAVWYGQRRTMVAYCASAEDVDAMRKRTPPDQGTEWNALIQSGEWIRFVKGETGELVRVAGS